MLKQVFMSVFFMIYVYNLVNGENMNIPIIEGKSFGRYASQYSEGRETYPDSFFKELAVRISKPEFIVDLGCGTGIATRQLKEQFPNAKVSGLDIDSDMLKEAEKVTPEKLSIDYQPCDVTKSLPLKDNSVDMITICTAYHWMSKTDEDKQKTLSEISRVLKPGGVVAIVEGNPFGDNSLMTKKLKELNDKISEMYIKNKALHPKRDVSNYNPETDLTKYGFKKIEKKIFSAKIKSTVSKDISRIQSRSQWNEIPKEDQPKALKFLTEELNAFCEKHNCFEYEKEKTSTVYFALPNK